MQSLIISSFQCTIHTWCKIFNQNNRISQHLSAKNTVMNYKIPISNSSLWHNSKRISKSRWWHTTLAWEETTSRVSKCQIKNRTITFRLTMKQQAFLIAIRPHNFWKEGILYRSILSTRGTNITALRTSLFWTKILLNQTITWEPRSIQMSSTGKLNRRDRIIRITLRS